MKDFRHKLELEIAITLAMQEKDVIISLVSIFFCYLISKYQMVHYIAQNIFFEFQNLFCGWGLKAKRY